MRVNEKLLQQTSLQVVIDLIFGGVRVTKILPDFNNENFFELTSKSID